MARKGETVLPDGGQPPYVAPGVDPAKLHGVAAYQAGIAARRAGGLPKADLPLNPERPPVPVLSGGPSPGSAGSGTMADYARRERAPVDLDRGIASVMGPGSIIEEAAPSPQAAAPKRQSPTTASLGLAPADLLPEQAKADPAYQQGYGSEYASNQPQLAAKYGVLRNGQFIPPQRLGGAKTSLRPETLKDLEALGQLQKGKAAPGLDQDEAATRRAVEEGMGGAAARVGNEPGDNSIKAPTDEQRTEVLKRAIDQMDAFEFNQWRQLTMKQLLHSEEQRELIESRLTPLSIDELITTNRIRQRIPIIPGKYEVTLQSYDGQVDLALKRLVMSESRSVDVGEQYTLDKYSFMTLTVGLHRINDKVYPEIFDEQGVFSDILFLAKFNMVMKLPIHMLASIGINQMWFEMRVRKLYSASAVGNG